MDYVGITVNKNMIPYDTKKPTVTSGIRFGTTVITIRGPVEKDMEEISCIIKEVSRNTGNRDKLDTIKEWVMELSKRFPLHSGEHDLS